MRIISGKHRSRRLSPPPERSTTRPLPDRVRESLFSLLRGHFEDAVVLDGFAGVGSFGLEAVSLGASRVVLVELDRRVADVLERNIGALNEEDRCEVVVGDALGPACLARCPGQIHLALLDPPYAMVRDPAGWKRVREQMVRIVSMLDETGYAMVRTPWPFSFDQDRNEEELPDLDIRGALGPETHVYKSTAVHLYMRNPEAKS